MSLLDDLRTEVIDIFRARWSKWDGTVVPDDTDVTLANDAVRLNATVLYADLADSTALVDAYEPSFAAEMYKAFLYSAARIISSESGVVTAYDGDRIMAVFLGKAKNTQAVRCALKIHRAVRMINALKSDAYPTNSYRLKHVVGIDTSNLFVAKTGARGANDLVWVGRAANYAAKLSALPASYPTYITNDVYNSMNARVKLSGSHDMWEAMDADAFDDLTLDAFTIYRSNWYYKTIP